MSLIGGIKYNAIFGKNISLTTSDLVLRGGWNPVSGTLPSNPLHGDWYMIVDTPGVLPAPVGVVDVGDAIFYCNDAGWFKGKANSVGVFTINGQDGAVTLTSDDISDAADVKKFVTQGEKIKLSGIEVGAQVNDTASQIKVKYESNADTNAFTDAYRSKLDLVDGNAEENVIETIKFNGIVLVPDGNKMVEMSTGAVFRIRGTVANYSELAFVTYKNDGDTYQTNDTGISYYFLNGGIESMGANIDLSSYYTKLETFSKTEVDNKLILKVDKEIGMGLSEESYSTVEKAKLANLEAFAQKNTGRVLVSLTDTVESELVSKIVPGTNITIEIVDSGGDEKLKISSTSGGGGIITVNGKIGPDVVLSKTDIGLANVTNHQQIPLSYLDADDTMASNSDLKVATQKAVRTRIENLSATNAHGVINQPSIVDNLDGTVTIGTDGIMQFHKDASGNIGLVRLAVPNGTTLAMIDNSVNFIYCDYNFGVPEYRVSVDRNIFIDNSQFNPTFRISREGTSLKIEDYGNYGSSQSEKILYKDTVLNGFERESGIILSTSATRQILISSGRVWFGIKPNDLAELTTGAANLFEYYKIGGAWTKSANLTEFDSTYYSNGTDKMTLSSGKYVSKYIYRDAGNSNELYYTSGNQYDSVASALSEKEPLAPFVMLSHSIYIGKIIIQKDSVLGYAYPRNWGDKTLSGNIVNHNDMENILLAGNGVTYGHISKDAQTIYGKKDFVEELGTTDITLSSMNGVNVIKDTSVKNSLKNIDNVYTVSKSSTGFTNSSSVTVIYSQAARTISLNGTFEAYFRGRKLSISNGWISTQHADVNGTYYLYHDGVSAFWTNTKYFDMLSIAEVYYSTSVKIGFRENHGFIGHNEHKTLHYNTGTYLVSGGDLTAIKNSTVAGDRRPDISTAEISDESLISTISSLSSKVYSRLSLSGVDGSIVFEKDTDDIVSLSGNVPYFNSLVGGVWGQSPMTEGNYQAVWIMAMPTTSDAESQKYRFICMQGQEQSASLQAISDKSASDLKYGKFLDSFSEFVFIGKIIIQYISGNWNIVSIDKLGGNRFSQTLVNKSNGLKTVSSDTTISGDGTVENPLSISSHINNVLNPHSVTKTQVGLGNCDNTSDINKPISLATSVELGIKQTVFTGICQEQYITENDIEIDCVSAIPTFTISTIKNREVITPSNPICFYTDGSGVAIRHTIPNSVSVQFAYTTGIWYFHFNSGGQLVATQTPWTDFSQIATVYRIYINETLSGQDRCVVESIEFHKNDISWTDHMWKHANGTVWINGGDITSNLLTIDSNGRPTSSPNTNGSNTVVSISSIKNEDDNMPYTVTNSLATAKFNQDLGNLIPGSLSSSNSALFKIRANDINGKLFFLSATRYPFAWDTVTNRPEYLTVSGVRTLVEDNRWFVSYIYALQDPRNGEAIKVASEISDFTTYTNAQASTWENLKSVYPTIRDNEIRPLYKIIFYCDSSGGGAYSSLCKYSAIVRIDDIRTSKVGSIPSISGTTPSTSVSVVPVGNISSTNLQSAIAELDTEKEPANTNIQTHISATSNPHNVTQIQIGLGNVTNNAQVKKIASSTDNAIMRWDGTTGDLPQNSLATISDTGTVNIPTGQNYNINGVNLKDVSETLTNKTLTSPVLNGEVTGTAITTAGEANRLIKTISAGNISMTQSVDGNVGVILNNTSSGVNANTGFQSKGNDLNYLSVWSYGSGRTGTIFGKTIGSYSALLAQGTDNAGLLLGTLSASPLVIGTNGIERYNIGTTGVHTFFTPAATSYNAIFRNTSYATTDTSGTSSIKIGYSNHDGIKLEAYKDTAFNISGIKFYGEYGIGTEKLLLNLRGSDSSAIFSGNIILNNGTGNNALLGLTSNAGLLSLRNNSSVENIRLDSSTAKVTIGNSTSTELNAMSWQDSRLSVYDSIGIQNNATLPKAIFFSVGSTVDSLNMINLVRQSGDTIFRQGVRSDGNALVFGDSGIERLVIHKSKFIDYVEEGTNGKLYVGRLNGAWSNPTGIVSGDIVGTFGTKGQYGTAKYQHAIGGVISFVATGNYISTTNAPTDLVVSLTTTAAAGVEKLRLTSAGNLSVSGYISNVRGANVASATTITPSGQIFHISGTTEIATINIPYTGFNGTIAIIPDGTFTTTTTGNIALASTAAVGRTLTMTYDSTTAKWYPSY